VRLGLARPGRGRPHVAWARLSLAWPLRPPGRLGLAQAARGWPRWWLGELGLPGGRRGSGEVAGQRNKKEREKKKKNEKIKEVFLGIILGNKKQVYFTFCFCSKSVLRNKKK